ncbi:MAG TPA: GNAT family N-acetyltransferase [Vicinamibacterales bacterium]|nr:GNAT family N-acetyltransferase [Vicinamibacterales bacterium]
MRNAPDRIETERLILRRPRLEDAEAVFTRYAGDPDVSRYMAWPLHRTPATTRLFLQFSDGEWAKWPAGPYLVSTRDGQLIGGTGFAFETPYRASTGYVFARDAWGRGYATETVRALVQLAPSLGIARLYALCHVDHRPSARVLEKTGFQYEGILRRYLAFPNIGDGSPSDVRCYSVVS